MSKVINVVSECSNVGKTTLIEGLIKELKLKGYSVGTIKHDAHEFEIDKKGKDTYRHRMAGADTIIISSKKRMAMIKELEYEIPLEKLIAMMEDKDFIIVEGYKKSSLRKIEVFREGISKNIITPKDKLIFLATNVTKNIPSVKEVNIDDYKKMVECLIKLEYN
ncbi:molybdopterin-guanine dinucleotide biosynthesis protein B [Clostridium moniliforme]|uniref:Molybdopterin-guanine dinucleotide biosynthesis protein B n=1 Tax=Clostridium moniliforme TaxID=39489 RepID=A0ABS4EYF5_9CLOT|nr:molybdopterin-guanine dinucleotide biosynthesis protein B [Clostridium moniliforme]MBP1889034.1 molybdopterin-guanine dinucleotide biosynthesis protein B [Clostridium moniliforme]